MRITCTATARGNVFRFYRSDESIYLELKPLTAFILGCGAELVIGGRVPSSGLLFSLGPMGAGEEAEFRHCASEYLLEYRVGRREAIAPGPVRLRSALHEFVVHWSEADRQVRLAEQRTLKSCLVARLRRNSSSIAWS